jgi:hypothetical protein
VPIRVTLVGALVALLANDALAEAVPLEVGVNVTVYGALWLAGMVTGNERPLIANSEPFIVTEETVTLAVAAASRPVVVPLVPTTTLPDTLTAVGFEVSVPALADTTVPLSGINRFGFEASEVTVTVPGNEPVDAGANVTLNDVLCPGARVVGMPKPLILEPVPVTPAPAMSRLLPPELATVSVSV